MTINREDLAKALVRSFSYCLDRAVEKRERGADYELELVCLNLLFVHGGIRVTDVLPDGSMYKEEIPDNKREEEYQKQLAEFLRLAPVNKLSKA